MKGDEVKSNHPFYVYLLLDYMGLPLYVGKGKDGRWLEHEKTVRNGRKTENPYKDYWIKKTIDVLKEVPCVMLAEGISTKEANIIETLFITCIGKYPNGPLTNVLPGGAEPPHDHYDRPSHREKLSKAAKGRKYTPEQRKAGALARTGIKRSTQARANLKAAQNRPEQKEKLRKANVGKILSPKFLEQMGTAHVGRKRSAESREKMREARLKWLAKNGY